MERPQRRRDDLDTALAEAAYAVATGPLKRERLFYQERRSVLGFATSGHAALWHVYQRFELTKDLALEVDYSTLMHFEFH